MIILSRHVYVHSRVYVCVCRGVPDQKTFIFFLQSDIFNNLAFLTPRLFRVASTLVFLSLIT